MKIFVYGKLMSGNSKAHLLPFVKNRKPFRLFGYKMYSRKNIRGKHHGTAGIKKATANYFVDGELITIEAPGSQILRMLREWLILFRLDINEGTFLNVYKRVRNYGFYFYTYEKSTKGCPVITNWREHS